MPIKFLLSLVLLTLPIAGSLAQTDSLSDAAPGKKIDLLLQLATSDGVDSVAAFNACYQAMAVATRGSIGQKKAEVTLQLGKLFKKFYANDSAKFYLNLSITKFREFGDRDMEAVAKMLLSEIYMDEDIRTTSMELQFECLAYYEEIGDSLEIGKTLNQIANTQNYLGHHEDALLQYGRALQVFRNIGYRAGEAHVLYDLGIIYEEDGDIRRSIQATKKAISVYESMHDSSQLIKSYGGVAYSYDNLQMWDSATHFFAKSMEFFDNDSPEKLKDIGFNYFYLNRHYNLMGLPDRGALYGKKAAKIAEQIRNSQLIENGNLELSVSLESLGQFKEALSHYKKYQEVQYAVYSKENSRIIHDMQVKYEAEKKEKELALKQADIDRQQAMLTEEARVREVLIGAIVIVALLAGLIYRAERAKAKAYDQLSIQNREIETKNLVIEAALSEKESLLKEIHHRVKNNLQVISSILNMQSRETTSPEILTAIQEGQSRVKAMALIHQKLYQTETLSEIDFKEYAEELTDHLSSVFQSPTGSIVKTVTSSDIKLDIDLAIPLGLILNELISNAYKHAFEGKAKGSIIVELRRVGEGQLQLNVADNGRGLPANFELEKAKSLGLKLVNILTRQLNGRLTMHSSGGAHFSIVIQNMK